LNNPIAKLVLLILTQYVNGYGDCFVGLKHLAEDCDLDVRTVRSRLDWLENIAKVIRRYPQFIDADGTRNTQRRGRQTTDLIRLLIEGVEQSSTEFEDEFRGSPDDPPRGDVRGDVGSDIYVSPPNKNLNMNMNYARSRSRAKAPAPARGKAIDSDPFDFVCHGTRWWRALEALDPDHMSKVPKNYYGVGKDANHTGWWFRRSQIKAALHHVNATGPPDDDSATDDATERNRDGEDDASDTRQLAASLRNTAQSLDDRASDRAGRGAPANGGSGDGHAAGMVRAANTAGS
jgi:hypothetical protein